VELRCPGRIHGKLNDGILEVKCHSNACGARSGTVVLHYFDIDTGELIETKRFQDATKMFTNKKEKAS
jgi:hypothetical protein